MKFTAMAAQSKGAKLERFSFDPGPLGDEQVEIAVQYCGICHSDVALITNEWGISQYPVVPGHEVIGKIVALGPRAKGFKVGQTVGLGWFSQSCMTCRPCLNGNNNLCPNNEQTIVGRFGGFADRVRCHWLWATPLPDGVDPTKAGPLFCGGITVFHPIVHFGVRPTDRVGVVGIGGLGHLALRFLSKWGCEVTAFTSSDNKKAEAQRLGAHRAITSTDDKQLESVKGQLDFLIFTATAKLNYKALLDALAPGGRLHFVGAVTEPVPVGVFDLLMGQKSISGSPSGSPGTIRTMLDFAARHQVAPVTEEFTLSDVNRALEHLEAGKARYRIVLRNDWA